MNFATVSVACFLVPAGGDHGVRGDRVDPDVGGVLHFLQEFPQHRVIEKLGCVLLQLVLRAFLLGFRRVL